MPFFETIDHKVGATFRRVLNVGNSLESDSVVTAQARQGNTYYDFSVRVLEPYESGFIEIELADTETQGWSIGRIPVDIRIEYSNGDVAKTETFYIFARAGITQDL